MGAGEEAGHNLDQRLLWTGLELRQGERGSLIGLGYILEIGPTRYASGLDAEGGERELKSPRFLVQALGWVEVLLIEVEKADDKWWGMFEGESLRSKVTCWYWLWSEQNVRSGHRVYRQLWL